MTTQNTTVLDSWNSRIEQFTKIIGLPVEEVEKALAEKPFELTKDTPYVLEMLSDDEVTPFGDMRKLFCDDRDVSLPKLRLGIKYLRGSKEKRKIATNEIDPDLLDLQSKYGFKTRFSDISPEELIPHYNPQKKNKITNALKKEFGNKPVIAFKPSSQKVAIEETINYIIDLNDGLPEEKMIDVDGELVKLHPVGKVPNQTVDEDPFFEGHPLKRGRSIINRTNWLGIEKLERQFARLLVIENEIDPNKRIEVRQTIADLKEGMESLKKNYPETYAEFKELKRKDELPKLILSMDEVVNKQNDPFGINRSY